MNEISKTITCERCGEEYPSTAHLAKHLKEMHGYPVGIAIEYAKEMRLRYSDADERVRRAAPELLAELETAIAWIEDDDNMYKPTRTEILPQLKRAVALAKGKQL